MAYSILNTIKSWFECCFPSPRPTSPSPIRRAEHHNARLRANLGMKERPIELLNYNGLDNTDPLSQSRSAAVYHTPIMTTRRPRIMSYGKYSADEGASTIEMSYMTRDQLKEVFNLIHDTLSHVPYAVCGLSALIDHGLTQRKAKTVSILCPQECKDNIKAWAATRGCAVYTNAIGVTMRDGSIRRVRIKYLEFGFEHLERVRSSMGAAAMVLSVTSQLDNVAAGYLQCIERGMAEAQIEIAADVFECLERLAKRREPINHNLLPTLLCEEFFVPFTTRFPEARPALAMAGIDVSAVLAKHRADASLREHDEMLRQYGAQGDVVPRQPGQFEGIRDLRGSRSAYTLKNRDSCVAPLDPLPLRTPLPPRLPLSVHIPNRVSSRKPISSKAREGHSQKQQQQQQEKQQKQEQEQKSSDSRNPLRTFGRSLTNPKENKTKKEAADDKPGSDWI